MLRINMILSDEMYVFFFCVRLPQSDQTITGKMVFILKQASGAVSVLVKLLLNSLWPNDIIWRQGSRSTLAQVIACCLSAPSHYLNQC